MPLKLYASGGCEFRSRKSELYKSEQGKINTWWTDIIM